MRVPTTDIRQCKVGPHAFVKYNHDLFKEAPTELFDPLENLDDLREQALGRGTTFLFSHGGVDFVRKHYQRGGYVGRWIRDCYFFVGLRRSRMWREFDLLWHLHGIGLPVPVPAAARCQLHFPFLYRGDLVTRYLPETQTLAEIVQTRPLSKETWALVGQSVRQFHQHDVFHADLNAANILLHRENGVSLLDFDKGTLRRRGKELWTQANLERLARSLWKWKRTAPRFHFSESDWSSLEEGYHSGSG